MDSCGCILVFSIHMWLMWSWFRAFSWSDAGIIILLPFIVVLSFIVISSLSYQYGCRSFCTSDLFDGQPYNIYSDSLLRYFSSVVTGIISSAVMQSDCPWMTLWHIWLCSFPILLCLCLSCGSAWTANLLWMTVVQLCTVILWYTDGCMIIFFVASVITLLHFLNITASDLWSVIMLTLWVKQ